MHKDRMSFSGGVILAKLDLVKRRRSTWVSALWEGLATMLAGKDAKVVIIAARPIAGPIERGRKQTQALPHSLRLPAWLVRLFAPRAPLPDVINYERGNRCFVRNGLTCVSAAEDARQRNIDIQSVFLLLPPFR
jgi:hypothetical protein